DLHTIKGGARMAGLMAIGELGHSMESLLEAVAEARSELDRDGVDLIQRGYDRLHVMVTRVGERRAIASSQALIAEFVARAAGGAQAPRVEEAAVPVVQKKALDPLSEPISDRPEAA